MTMANSKTQYGWVAVVLHWLIAAAVVVMLYYGLRAGWAEHAGDRELRSAMLRIHTGVGGLVLFFVLARLWWSLSQPKPDLLGASPAQNLAARVVHGALLLGLLILVVSGPLMVWSNAHDVSVVGVFSLPTPFTSRNHTVHEAAEVAHAIGRWILFIGIPVHVLAALKHQFVDRDQTLQRMLWVSR